MVVRKEISPDKFWVENLYNMVDIAKVASFQPPIDFEAATVNLLDSFACASCGEDVDEPRAYCSDFCQNFAGLVRYFRKATSEGRQNGVDFKQGVCAKLLSLFQGGYPSRERRLSQTQRQAIFDRDQGICQLCGGHADQIDHISGDSCDPLNLRAVCGPCNLARVMIDRKASPEEVAEFQDWANQICTILALRIANPSPQFVCDDYDRWAKEELRIRAKRKRLFKEIEEEAEGEFEDVDGYLYHSMQKDD